jgi:hypothetical protein
MNDTITLETATARHERSLQILKSDPAARVFVDLRRAWSTKHSEMEAAARKLEAISGETLALWKELKEAKAQMSAEAMEHFG